MELTLSERRMSEQIRQLEGIEDTVEEITHRMDRYAARLFKHLYGGYGIRFVGMLNQSGGLGTFSFDIGGVGRNYQTNDFDWEKLRGGLSMLNPVSVTVTADDIGHICTGLIKPLALDAFPQFARELERITVPEIESKIESALLHHVHQRSIEMPSDPRLRELQIQGEFARAGIVDPSLRSQAAEQYRQREEERMKAEQFAHYQEFIR